MGFKTQDEAADALGASRRTYREWRQGRKPHDTVERLVRRLTHYIERYGVSEDLP